MNRKFIFIILTQHDFEPMILVSFIWNLKSTKIYNTKLRSNSLHYQKLLPIVINDIMNRWLMVGDRREFAKIYIHSRIHAAFSYWHKPVKTVQTSLDFSRVSYKPVRSYSPAHTVLFLGGLPPGGCPFRSRGGGSGAVGCCSSFQVRNFLTINETMRRPPQTNPDDNRHHALSASSHQCVTLSQGSSDGILRAWFDLIRTIAAAQLTGQRTNRTLTTPRDPSDHVTGSHSLVTWSADGSAAGSGLSWAPRTLRSSRSNMACASGVTAIGIGKIADSSSLGGRPAAVSSHEQTVDAYIVNIIAQKRKEKGSTTCEIYVE